MRTSSEINESIRRIPLEVRTLVERRIELILLEVTGQVSKEAAKSVHKGMGLIFGLLGLAFLLIALALFLGELTGSRSLGFLLAALPFLFLGLLFVNLKPRSAVQKTEDKIASSMMKAIDSIRSSEENVQPRLPEHSSTKSLTE